MADRPNDLPPIRTFDDFGGAWSEPVDTHGGDVQAQFWGSAPTWRDTGALPRTDRSGRLRDRTPARGTRRADRTGPIERTRTHRVVERGATAEHRAVRTGAVAATPPPPPSRADRRLVEAPWADAAWDEAAWDDVDVELELQPTPAAARREDAVGRLVERLGLGAVDPLLVRLGAIILVGVLLAPLALALRGGASAGDLVASELPAAAAPAIAPAPEATPATAPASASTAPAPAPASQGAATAAAGTVGATAQTVTTDTSDDSADADDTTDEAATAPTTAGRLVEAADAEEPAERLEPECAATYVAVAGDYWLRLADETGLELSELLAANLATVDTPLYPGSEVCLPPGAAMPSPPTTAPAPTTTPTTVPRSAPAPTTTQAPRPTTTTTTTTTAPPAPTVAPASPAEVQAMIREIWPDDLEDKALDVAYRESRYVATAYNGWCCYGVFQVHWTAHRSWLAGIGITSSSQLLDARTNIEIAYAIYQRAGGWGPWGG